MSMAWVKVGELLGIERNAGATPMPRWGLITSMPVGFYPQGQMAHQSNRERRTNLAKTH